MKESSDKMITDLQIEEYKAAKAEILSAINLQYTILSILAAATASIFLYLFEKKSGDIYKSIICINLIIPGLYAFFGILWLDQVYRHRRLASFVFQIEKNNNMQPGWEHAVSSQRKEKKIVGPCRYYYYVCLGLFILISPATFYFAKYYFTKTQSINLLRLTNYYSIFIFAGIAFYVIFLVFCSAYIIAILYLVNESDKKEELSESESPIGD